MEGMTTITLSDEYFEPLLMKLKDIPSKRWGVDYNIMTCKLFYLDESVVKITIKCFHHPTLYQLSMKIGDTEYLKNNIVNCQRKISRENAMLTIEYCSTGRK